MSDIFEAITDGKPKYYYDSDVRGWQYCYYFLYEYELGNSPLGVAPLPWAGDQNKKISTQEHILPQQHRDGGWWEAQWPEPERAERFKHRLGNLVLTNGNPVLGRMTIGLKLEDPTAEYGYTHPNATNGEKLISKYTDGESWNAENIVKREADLAVFAVSRWGLSCCCDNGALDWPREFLELCEELPVIYVDESDCIEEKGVSSLPDSETDDGIFSTDD